MRDDGTCVTFSYSFRLEWHDMRREPTMYACTIYELTTGSMQCFAMYAE